MKQRSKTNNVKIILLSLRRLVFIILFFYIVFLLVKPIFPEICTVLHAQTQIPTDDKKNYYAIFSNIATIIWGMLGVILGLFYYFHRINYDRDTAIRNRMREQVTVLLQTLKEYDDLVEKIFCKEFENDKELDCIRAKITALYYWMAEPIKIATKIGCLNEDEIQKLIRVHSFVEKNKYLMELSCGQMEKQTEEKSILIEWRYEYHERMQEAQSICLICLIEDRKF